MQRKISILLLLFIMTIVGLFAFKKGFTRVENLENNSKNRVLIVYQKNDFKTQVVQKIKTYLNRRRIDNVIVSSNSAKKEDISQYSNILIFTTKKFGKIGSAEKKFKKRIKDKDKVLLIVTAGDKKGFSKKELGVDVISSASEKKDIDTIVENIINHIEKSLKSNENRN